MTLPSKSPITLEFGATTAPYSPQSPHAGTDFSYIPDNKIYAPFSGRVTCVPNNGRDGNGLYMTEPNGNFHGMLHSSQYLVSTGDLVTEGQPIAIMGDTGYAFGVHLHYCVKVNGIFIDPLILVEGGNVNPSVTIVGAPAVASWGEGRLDVFVRGSDNNLWHKWYDIAAGGTWQAWEKVGEAIASSPSVAAWAKGRLDIFATGVANDLMHFYYPDPSGNFSVPESLGVPQ